MSSDLLEVLIAILTHSRTESTDLEQRWGIGFGHVPVLIKFDVPGVDNLLASMQEQYPRISHSALHTHALHTKQVILLSAWLQFACLDARALYWFTFESTDPIRDFTSR